MAETTNKSVFETLNAINCNEHTEQKNGLTYLSWPYAWAEVKKIYPDATYEVKKFDGKPYVSDDKFGIMVYTSVTIEGITHEMWLPVMDGANNAMKAEPYTFQVYDKYKKNWIEKRVDAADMFDINKTIMRCLVKNLGMFGCGLYIYAGEDLPEVEKIEQVVQAEAEKEKQEADKEKQKADQEENIYLQLICAAAEGRKTKSGDNPRDWYIKHTQPSEFELMQFDDDVAAYKANPKTK